MKREEEIRLASMHECTVNRAGFVLGAKWADTHRDNKPEVFTVSSRLQAAIDALELIEKSGYIPFASPSPSSTEAEIKHAILRAHSELSHALKVHNRCYTLNGF